MRLLIIFLIIVVVAVYASIMLPEEHRLPGMNEIAKLVESNSSAPASEPQTQRPALQPVPEEQLQLIQDVFAPELK